MTILKQKSHIHERYFTLQCLIELASLGDKIYLEQKKRIISYTRDMGIPISKIADLLKEYKLHSLNHYHIPGASPDMALELIRKCNIGLAKFLYPDRFLHQPENEQLQTTEKMKTINETCSKILKEKQNIH